MNEAELQSQIIELARIYGWRVAHHRPARTERGWRTPVQGDRGSPDLLLANRKRGQVLFAELKADSGRPTADQELWLEALRAAAERAVHVARAAPFRSPLLVELWRPADFDRAHQLLRGL